MFIQARKLSVARGFSEAAVNKFKTSTLLPQQPGFDSIETYVRSVNKESEEVLVLIKWGTKKIGRTGKRAMSIKPVIALRKSILSISWVWK